MSHLIILTTDFGLSDAFVGTMKGVILGIAPKAKLIDLTHDIEPQNIQHAALVLASAAPYFPKKAIHLVVVDPGVGTERRAIAVETPHAIFVGPDNGVLTPAFSQRNKIYELTEPQYFLQSVSNTFHGRDLFAPVAAHLAAGVKLSKLGRKITDPTTLDLPQPETENTTLRGQILYADRFGNVTTNISVQDIERFLPARPTALRTGKRTIKQFVRTYGDCAAGKSGFLLNSWNLLEIFVRNGNARQAFNLKPGTAVTLRFS